MRFNAAKATKEILYKEDKVGQNKQNFSIVPPFWALNCGPACFALLKPKQLPLCNVSIIITQPNDEWR